jgi:nucleolin
VTATLTLQIRTLPPLLPLPMAKWVLIFFLAVKKSLIAFLRAQSKKVSSDESSESSSSEDEKPKAVAVKATPAKAAAAAADSSDDSDSDDEPALAPAPKITKAVPPTPASTKKTVVKKKAESSSSSSEESSSDDDPPPPAKAAAPAASTSSSDDDSSEDEAPAKPVAGKKAEDSSDSSDDADEDSDVEMADAPAVSGGDWFFGFSSALSLINILGKRKAVDDEAAPPKKVKLANGDAASAGGEEESKSIFVGRLSWSVDNDRLAQEFAECGEVVSATVQMDRNTGKSRGFGYVHFATTEAVEKALAMNGQEIDGRAVNIDRSQQLDKSQVREKRAQAFGDEASPPSATLFVGNLSFGVTEDTVWTFFNEWGVKSVRLPTDRETGRPKGFGYVEFEDIEGAKKAFEGAAGAEIEGRAIRLDYSQPRDSSGGGFGGGRGGFGGDRGGRGGSRGGRGGFGDRGGRGGGRGGFGDRGGRGGGRGGFGDRGGGRGRGAPRGGARNGGITAFEGKKTTF